MIGVRAQVLHFHARSPADLPLQARAPLIHTLRRLVPGSRHNGTRRGSGRTNPGGDRIRQSGDLLARPHGVSTGQDSNKRWVVAQERVAVGLIGIVVDTGSAAKYRLFIDAVSESETGRPVVVVGGDKSETGCASYQRGLAWIEFRSHSVDGVRHRRQFITQPVVES